MPLLRVLFLLTAVLAFGNIARADEDKTYQVKVCNNATDGNISVALGLFDSPVDEHITIHGWWTVPQGECRVVATRRFGNYSSHPFYIHGHVRNGNRWPDDSRTDTKFCLSDQVYERQNRTGYNCRNNEQLREFAKIVVQKGEDTVTTYTVTLNESENIQFE